MKGRVKTPYPILSLETDSIAKLGTLDVDNLFYMWNVFTKCGENLQNGRRLENLSWRLWYRSTCVTDECESAVAPVSGTGVLPMSTSASLPSTCKPVPSNVTESSQATTVCKLTTGSLSSSITTTTTAVSEVNKQQENVVVNNRKRPAAVLGRTHSRRGTFRSLSTDAFNQLITAFSPIGMPRSSRSSEQLSKKPKNDGVLAQHRTETIIEEKASRSSSTFSDDKNKQNMKCDMINTGKKCHTKERTQLSNAVTKLIAAKQTLSEKKSKSKFSEITVGPESTQSVVHGFVPGELEVSVESLHKDGEPSLGRKLNKSCFYLATNEEGSESSDESQVGDSLQQTTSSRSRSSVNADDEDDEDAWVSVSDSDSPPFQKVATPILKRPPLKQRTSMLSCLLLNKEQSDDDTRSTRSAGAASRYLRNSSVKTEPIHSTVNIASNTVLSTVNTCCDSPVSRRLPLERCSSNKRILVTEISESLRRNLLWERQQKSTLPIAAFRQRTHSGYFTAVQSPSNAVQVTKDFMNDCTVW
ncbi:DUF1752 family protein [Schizosaccharomyces japonicus yFS275]|uniref:DUF1752 family protein n=1 Tax=Schizosaccharomyces japonicus (strain yFS275 / FY16936) TaxID=402676 RepID=B6K3X3_SCHJY|nr:DUF1752 family protein [Schizosaccharomyces japonicus yFS275]EEB08180.1 DUF1752 family protein [Schizosaccharomyces japonicus yFS275]